MDPLADKFPSVNSYVGMGNNPVMFVDTWGDYVWVFNDHIENKWTNSPYYNAVINTSAKKYNYIKIDDALKKNIEDLINIDFVNNSWGNPQSKHYAPNVAKHVIQTQIPIAIANMDGFDGVNHRYGNSEKLYNFIVFDNDARLGSTSYSFEGIALHELVHNFNENNGEFEAYSAQYAAGYDRELIKGIISFEDTGFYESENDKNILEVQDKIIFGAYNKAKKLGIENEIFVDDDLTNIKDYNKLYKLMDEYGKEIIGTKNESK